MHKSANKVAGCRGGQLIGASPSSATLVNSLQGRLGLEGKFRRLGRGLVAMRQGMVDCTVCSRSQWALKARPAIARPPMIEARPPAMGSLPANGNTVNPVEHYRNLQAAPL